MQSDRPTAGEKTRERAKICAIFCKIVQKVLDGRTHHVVSSYLPVKEGFLFARICFSARKKKRPFNLKQGGNRQFRTARGQWS